MPLGNLTPEQKEKARNCKSVEELTEFVEDEGIELSDEDLDAISGGDDWGGCSDHECGVPFYR